MRALLILLLLTMSPSFLQAQTLLNQTLNLDTGSGLSLCGTSRLPYRVPWSVSRLMGSCRVVLA